MSAFANRGRAAKMRWGAMCHAQTFCAAVEPRDGCVARLI